MCDFYPIKNPEVHFKEFGHFYEGPHDRMQLIPRKTYKSSIKVVEDVQWIICFPEIRILTVTAEIGLATAFNGELTTYFTVRGKAERNPETNLLEGGRPNEFQQLFPEHCISESEATAHEYTTPARASLPPGLIFKEPTAGTLSMGGTSSGWHCDVMDFDDPVSDRNTESGKLLDPLYNRIAMITELLESHGFRNFVATRYDVDDPYGRIAENMGVKQLYGDCEPKDQGFKYMCRPCWWLKGRPYEQPDYRTWTPVESELDLFFPEGAPFKVLKKKMKAPKTFSSQQLNSPSQQVNVTFPEDFVRGLFVPATALPKTGMIFASWDFAYGMGESVTEDYSVGVVGLLDAKCEWWVIDVVCEHFTPTEKAYQVIKMIRDHHPRRTCIENTPGVKGLMEESIDRQAKKEKIVTNIDWISVGMGIADAKYLRIAKLHPYATDNRIHFLNNISCADEIVKEFSNVRRGRSKHRNDIPDAIARMVEQYSRYGDQVAGMQLTQDEAAQKFVERGQQELFDLLHGQGKYAEGGAWALGMYDADYREPSVDAEALDPNSPSYAIDSMMKDNF